jgi:hypothetical protein
MDKKTLRPAEELRAEAEQKLAREFNDSSGLVKAATLINEAHAHGCRSVTYLTFSDWVVQQLKAAGYKVTYHPACSMGDMPSHTIEW